MKHAVLHSIGHNVADSLGSGCSLLTGCYEFDLFADLRRAGRAEVTVDLLAGSVEPNIPSDQLGQAAQRAPMVLADLCRAAGTDVGEFVDARARFWIDATGSRCDVIVADVRGRTTMQQYAGVPAARMVMLDERGRRRPKPPLAIAV